MTENGKNGVENETLQAAAQGTSQPESCLKKHRVTVTFSPGHREFLEEVEKRLQHSPRAEKPVTPTTIIATVCEVAQGALINSGRFEPPVIKTADTLLDEGKAALDEQAAQEAVSGSETPVDGSSKDAAQKPYTEFKPVAWESKHPGNCASCGTRYDRRVQVTRIGEKEYLGLDCCPSGIETAASVALISP